MGSMVLAVSVSGESGARVWDNFQVAQPCACISPTAQEQAPVRRRRESFRARPREIRARVQIDSNPERVIEQNSVGVILRRDIDSPHDLDEPAGLHTIVSAIFVDGLADEVQHFQLSRLLYTRKYNS